MSNLPMLTPRSDTISWLRCPRSSCADYKRRLVVEVGQHEDRGDLTVEHRCPTCDYSERGPSTPAAARRSSPLVRSAAERLLALRTEGVPVRLTVDDAPWPEEEW